MANGVPTVAVFGKANNQGEYDWPGHEYMNQKGYADLK
jgi:hypothetical protein